MAKPITFQLLRDYADQAKLYDAERDKQYRMYTQFAYQIDSLLSGDQIDSSPQWGRYNIIKSQINQICNPVLDQPPEVTVYPGDGATKSAAVALGGTIRHFQYECMASQAYCAAMRMATSGGLGAWLAVLDDDDEAQGLQPAIEGIADPTTVHFDPTHKRPDRRDARFVSREYTMAADDFVDRFPGKQLPQEAPDSPASIQITETVLLTELYVRVKRDGRKAINRYVISDLEIIEKDETYPVSKFPVYLLEAPKCDIEGKLTMMPLTFDLIDVQRELAYWKTQTAKLMGRAPKSTWLWDKGSVAVEDQEDYAKSALDDEAVTGLVYDSKNGSKRPPELIKAPELPSSYLELIQHNLAFARDITGIYPDQGQMQQKGTDPASGVAIKQQRSISTIAAAHFTNQLNYNLRLTGDWMVEVAQRILNDDKVRISMQGDNSTQLVSYGPTKAEGMANYDLEAGKFGVIVATGPNYASQKQELLQQLGEMANKNPKVFELIADYLVAQWPLAGTEDLQERLQVGLLPPEVKKLIASKANSDPAARAQQLQLQLQQVTMTKEQLQQVLEVISKQLTDLSAEHKSLQEDKAIEVEKLSIDRLKIESAERIALHKTTAMADDVDAKNATTREIAQDRNVTTLEVAAMNAETKVGVTAMQHNHEEQMADEARKAAEKEAKEDDEDGSELPHPLD